MRGSGSSHICAESKGASAALVAWREVKAKGFSCEPAIDPNPACAFALGESPAIVGGITDLIIGALAFTSLVANGSAAA